MYSDQIQTRFGIKIYQNKLEFDDKLTIRLKKSGFNILQLQNTMQITLSGHKDKIDKAAEYMQ